MFEDFEFDMKAIVISLLFSIIFLGFMWKSSIWDGVPIKTKIIISIAMPPVLYFVVLWQINK